MVSAPGVTSTPLTSGIAEAVKEQKPRRFRRPEKAEEDVVLRAYELFRDTANMRNQSYAYFDNRSIIDYIDDSVRRFSTNVDYRDGIEDWQAAVFDPFTRNKVMAILSKVSQNMPGVEFVGVGDEDYRRSTIIHDLYEHADTADDTEQLMFNCLLEAAVKGTVIGYEGYEERTRVVKDAKKYDGASELTVTEGKSVRRRLVGSIIPLEDFYPCSPGIQKITDMPYCFWRTVLTMAEFEMQFGSYKRVRDKEVEGFVNVSDKDAERPYYYDYMYAAIPQDHVEVIRYYNQDKDEFIVIANGTWLNALDGWVIMPIPFAHKQLPFWKAMYEPHGSDFFWGKSLPDKLKSMQDVINVLHNMMLDQSFLSIFPPLLTDANDDIDDDVLRPGRRIPVSNPNNFKELHISSPSGFHQYIMEYTKRVLEETSVDAVNQGIAGSADRVTATEVERAAQAVQALIGLFGKFVTWGVKDKARLRVKNILQFYTKPLIEQAWGEGSTEEFNKAFNTIKVEDSVLSSGRRGMKIIEMYQSRDQMPDRGSLRADAAVIEAQTGKKVEKVAISPEYIRNFEFDVKIVPNPKTEMSAAMNRALVLEKAKVYMTLFPDIVDKEQVALEIAEAYGDRPERIFRRELFEPKEAQPQQQEQGAPSTGLTENMRNKAMGAQNPGTDMTALMGPGNVAGF